MGQWFRFDRTRPEVKAGAVFRCRLPSHVIETAEVIEVGPDAMGIQHVKYNLVVAGGTVSSFAEIRTLGLESFADRYNEPVAAS